MTTATPTMLGAARAVTGSAHHVCFGEVVERALAPYADKVPPAVLEQMRLAMREDLISHPTSRDLAKRLRARVRQMQRDDVAVPGVEAGATPKTGKAPR